MLPGLRAQRCLTNAWLIVQLVSGSATYRQYGKPTQTGERESTSRCTPEESSSNMQMLVQELPMRVLVFPKILLPAVPSTCI